MQGATLPCGKCGTPMVVQVGVPPALLNYGTVSLLVMEHDGPVRCPACGVPMQVVVAAYQAVVLRLVEVPGERQLITPANNGKLILPQ